MSEENCTLNQNGTLKEAHNITWYNDLDDEIPISQPSDLEAEVLTELPTDDKADTDHADNFIDDHFNDEDIDGTDNEYNIPISQLALTRAVESVPNHGFIGYLLDKYGNNEGTYKSKHSISHEGIRDDDWPLFDVPVKDGTEELIVYALSYQAGSKHICSAFASVVIPGHVYVEARNISDIQAVTSIYQDVYSKYICPVPTEHTWVRLKGKYHYDLAFITNDIQEDSATLRLANSHTVCCRNAKLGDGVQVISGEHKGSVGMVINSEPYGRIGENNVMIVTFPLKKVLSSNLDFCDEVHRNTTFRWQDSDFSRFSARHYVIIKAGPLKGELGILQDVNFNGVAVVEIQTHLMTSNRCESVSLKDIFIPSSRERPFTSSIATVCFASGVNGLFQWCNIGSHG
ncbi:hypothetical protein BDQ17DRAFT_1333561 [Cyathus striatus]|nr:hypothetical protein BDQ17DRAFT_1333561 [Cyathus striatus]